MKSLTKSHYYFCFSLRKRILSNTFSINRNNWKFHWGCFFFFKFENAQKNVSISVSIIYNFWLTKFVSELSLTVFQLVANYLINPRVFGLYRGCCITEGWSISTPGRSLGPILTLCELTDYQTSLWLAKIW